MELFRQAFDLYESVSKPVSIAKNLSNSKY